MNITNVMLPIILLVLTGWIFSFLNIFKEDAEKYLNKLIFNLSLPAIMFVSIEQYGIKNILNIKFAIAYTLSIALPLTISFFIFRYLKKYPIFDCVFIGMNSSISNSGLITMPILLGIFGLMGGIPAAAMLTISSMLIIPFLVFVIEYTSSPQQSNQFLIFFSAFCKTLFQPFVLATFTAAALNACLIHIPKPILTYMQFLADLTVPCALIAVGINLSTRKEHVLKLEIFFISFLNLVIKPLIAILLALMFHLSKLYGIALIIVSAAPVANSIYILASKYNIYKSESAQTSFFTNFFSILTLPFFTWIAFKLWP